MISIIQNGEVYEIRFSYNEAILDMVRQVPGRRWHHEAKFWAVPKDKIGFFLNQLKDTSFYQQLKIQSDEDLKVNCSIDSTHKQAIPDIDISDIPLYVEHGSRLYEHQIDCMKYSIGRKDKGNFNGFLLSDEMGCGKTLEVINLALFKKNYENAKHCLIICCVNSAKYNWADDIKKHTNEEYEGYILGSRVQKRKGTVQLNGTGTEKYKDLETGLMYSDEKLNKPLPYFLILNVEALRTTDNSKKRYERNIVTMKIVQMCLDRDISIIALDEIHKNVSPQSEQGKQILKIKQLTNNLVEWIPITGTPVVNKPTDVFLPMYLVGAHNESSYWRWNQHFCIYGGYGGHNIIGYKNIPELKRLLEPNMLRRTKEQVLDLPPKVHHIEYVENSKYQDRLYKTIQSNIRNNFDEVYRSPDPLSQLVALREVNECPEVIDSELDPTDKSYLNNNAKIKRAVELILDIIENGEKVVVFSNWVAPLRSLYRQLKTKKINIACYTGTMSQNERESDKKKFISDPSCKVIIGTIGALGTSHTLTVANNVIFIDEPWNMATLEQAEDRCHRVTSTGTTNIFTLITRGTIDEKIHDILNRKGVMSNFIVDDKIDVRNNPELIRYLVE